MERESEQHWKCWVQLYFAGKRISMSQVDFQGIEFWNFQNCSDKD